MCIILHVLMWNHWMNTLMKKIKVTLTENAWKNVLEIEFYPSWNILEYTGISFLHCCTNPVNIYRNSASSVNFEFLATLFFGIILFITTQSSIEALLDYPHRINVWILHVVHFSGKSYIKNFSTYSINVYYVMSITCKATLYSLYVYASIHWIIFFQHREISVWHFCC